MESCFNPLGKWRIESQVLSCFSFHSLYIVHFRLIVYLSILGFNVIAGDLAQSILLTFDEYTIFFGIYIFSKCTSLIFIVFIHLKSSYVWLGCTFGIWCTSLIFFSLTRFCVVLFGFWPQRLTCVDDRLYWWNCCSESLGTALLFRLKCSCFAGFGCFCLKKINK